VSEHLVGTSVVGALGGALFWLSRSLYEKTRNKNGYGVEARMKALEERVHKQVALVQGYLARVAVAEANLSNTTERLERIEQAIDRLADKLDRVLGR
jgi:uncharacterized coiled-coil protein SlyX